MLYALPSYSLFKFESLLDSTFSYLVDSTAMTMALLFFRIPNSVTKMTSFHQ